MIRTSALLLAALLCACNTGEPIPPLDLTEPFHPPAPFELPYAGVMIGTPDFANATLVTEAEVPLRTRQEDESEVIAMLPKGTPLVPAGNSGGECMCTRVATPDGVGWVYDRYMALRLPPAE